MPVLIVTETGRRQRKRQVTDTDISCHVVIVINCSNLQGYKNQVVGARSEIRETRLSLLSWWLIYILTEYFIFPLGTNIYSLPGCECIECQHGSSCEEDGVNSFCQCGEDYVGGVCEHGKFILKILNFRSSATWDTNPAVPRNPIGPL